MDERETKALEQHIRFYKRNVLDAGKQRICAYLRSRDLILKCNKLTIIDIVVEGFESKK